MRASVCAMDCIEDSALNITRKAFVISQVDVVLSAADVSLDAPRNAIERIKMIPRNLLVGTR